MKNGREGIWKYSLPAIFIALREGLGGRIDQSISSFDIRSFRRSAFCSLISLEARDSM